MTGPAAAVAISAILRRRGVAAHHRCRILLRLPATPGHWYACRMTDVVEGERVGGPSRRRRGRWAGRQRIQFGLVLGALGVVYGDIGTSPLYAMQTVFGIDNGAVRPTASDLFGVVSLVFWSITLIVSIKYVVFVMRADNAGEGGVMALAALARRVLANATGR